MKHGALERPQTDNYFQFYGLKAQFTIDKIELKRLFLEKSKQYHPDYYVEDPASQSIAIATSAYNNIAHKTLNNDIQRAKYLIDLKLIGEDETQTLPQAFLMEMMDLNEAIDEANEINQSGILIQIQKFKAERLKNITELATKEDWHETQIELLKWKYLERLESRLT